MKIFNFKYIVLAFFVTFILFLTYFFQERKIIQEYEKYAQEKNHALSTSLESYYQKLKDEIAAQLGDKSLEPLISALKEGYQKGIDAKEYIDSKREWEKAIIPLTQKVGFKRLLFLSKRGNIIYSSDGEDLGLNIYKKSFSHNEWGLSLLVAHLCETFTKSQVFFNKAHQREEIYFNFPYQGPHCFSIAFQPFPSLMPQNDQEVTSGFFQLKGNKIFTVRSLNSDFSLIHPYLPFQNDPLNLALDGKSGAGVKELDGTQVIASWNYIPSLQGGIVTKIDLRYALQSRQFLKRIFEVFLLITLILVLGYLYNRWKERIILSPKILCLSFAIMGLLGIGSFIFLYQKAQKESSSLILEMIAENINEVSEKISHEMEDIVQTTDWIAEDLNNKRLKEEDLRIRLEREFQETPSLQKIQVFSPKITLQAERKHKHLNIAPFVGKMPEKEKGWQKPQFDEKEKRTYIIYHVPFERGVIASYFDVSALEKKMEELPLGGSARGLLLDEAKKRDLKLPHEGFSSHYDPIHHEKEIFFLKKIRQSPLYIAGMVKDSSMELDISYLRQLLFLLITSLLLLVLSFLILIFFVFAKRPLFFVIFYVIFVCVGVAALWITQYLTSQKPEVSGVVVKDEKELENLVSKIKQENALLQKPEPLFVPTSIFVKFLKIESDHQISLSAKVTQKTPPLYAGIFFPQSKELHIEKIASSGDDFELFRVRTTLLQNRDKSSFPFDNYLIRIAMLSASEDEQVYLIPDLTTHKLVEHEKTLKKITFPGYRLTETFYSLENHTLYYNIFLVRRFLIPFIPFLIPLIVIQIGMYSIFILTTRKRGINFMTSISIYTGGFFAFAILQLSLRTHYAGENILYAETFFFIGYFLISLLYAHAVLTKIKPETSLIVRKKSFLNLLYWPFQVSLWYLIAFLYFFN